MYKTTSRQERIDNAKAKLTTGLKGAEATLSQSNINVLGTVIGAVAFELEQHIKYVADNIMLLTAEEQYLDSIHGKLWQVERKQATKEKALAEFDGLNGSLIAENIELKRADGKVYKILNAAIIESGKAAVEIESVEFGKSVNLTVGESLSLTTPVEGIQGESTVKEVLKVAQNTEKDEAYKARIQFYINNRHNTGTLADYELWAKEVKGVENAYAIRNINGSGTVGVCIIAQDDITQTVKEYIETKAPVGAEIYVVTPTKVNQDITVNIKPFSDNTKQQVNSAIEQFFNTIEYEQDIIVTQFNKAISDIPEVEDFNSTLVQNITIEEGSIANLGTLIIKELN